MLHCFLGYASGVGGKSACNAAAVVLCHSAVRWKSCTTALHFLLYFCSLWWIPLSALSCCTTMHRCNVEKLHWFLQSCFLSCGKSIFRAAGLCCAARHTYIKKLYCFSFGLWFILVANLPPLHGCRFPCCMLVVWGKAALLLSVMVRILVPHPRPFHHCRCTVLHCYAQALRGKAASHFQPFLSRGGKSTPIAPLQIFWAALQSIGIMLESSIASFSMCCTAPLCIGVRWKSCVASLCHGSHLVANPPQLQQLCAAPQCIGVTWKSCIALGGGLWLALAGNTFIAPL